MRNLIWHADHIQHSSNQLLVANALVYSLTLFVLVSPRFTSGLVLFNFCWKSHDGCRCFSSGGGDGGTRRGLKWCT